MRGLSRSCHASSASAETASTTTTQPSRMKFVQLYSGGKDSCYSMMECIAEGHEVVCLAHLAPPADQEEIDSFMFQSAGHSTIELIAAECLDLPLVRRVISGKAIDQGITYSETSEDEVEEAADDEAEEEDDKKEEEEKKDEEEEPKKDEDL